MTSTDPNPPAAATTKPKTEQHGTSYTVLGRTADTGSWLEMGEHIARNTSEAIRIAVALHDHPFAAYVAIPERSFQPVRVKIETVQRIKLEDA